MANTVLGRGPGLQIEYSAKQTWGSGTRRTIQIDFGAKVYGSTNQSKFQYSARYYIVVNGVEGSWRQLKPVEWWYATQGYRWYSDSLTVDVGTTGGGNVPVKIVFDSGGHGWEHTLPFTASYSKTNTAPSAPGKPVITGNNWQGSGGTVLSGIFNERINYMYLEWPRASDAEGDTITYHLEEQVNEGNWITLYEGTNPWYEQSIMANAEGRSYKYWVQARDSNGSTSDGVYSDFVKKNEFTMATLASSSYIDKNTQSISFSWSGGSNTQRGVGINYNFSCQGLTIYSLPSTVSSPLTIKIKKGGESISGPYIMWSDLLSKFNNDSDRGKGRITFTLTGTNTNGTSKTSTKTMSVDVQANPTGGSAYISTSPSESTCAKTTRDTKQTYLIPDGNGTIRVKWTAPTLSLGGGLNYRVYYAFDSESWQELTSSPITSTYFNHIPSKLTKSRQIKYRIRAISNYNDGVYTDLQTSPQTLHFYNPPALTKGSITRTASTADVNITVKSNSSISGINTVGTWSCSGASPSSGALAQSQSNQVIKLSGLSERNTYSLVITYNDSTGFTSDSKTETVSVGTQQPIFYINKYGAGIGGRKASSDFSLDVKGTTRTNNIRLISRNGAIDCDKLIGDELLLCGNSAPNRPSDWSMVRGLGESDSYGLQIGTSYGSMNQFYLRSTHDTQRKYKPWARIYTDKDKPTASEVGALSLNGGTINGDLTCNNYFSLNAYPGSVAGTARFWYNGNSKSIHIDTADQLYFGGKGVVKPIVDTQYDVSGNGAFAMNGLREGLVDLNGDIGFVYNWFGISTDGNGQMIRDVIPNPSIVRRIAYPLGGVQITTYANTSWGYSIGDYDNVRGVFHVKCADFGGNRGDAGQGQILMMVKLK